MSVMIRTTLLHAGAHLWLILLTPGAIAAESAAMDAGAAGPSLTRQEATTADPATDAEPEAAPSPSVVYRWRNRHGELQYTDFEPEGIPSQRIELDPAAGWEGAPLLERAGAPGTAADTDDNCAAARAELAAAHDPSEPGGARDAAVARARGAVLERCQPAAFAPDAEPD
jgi:hypothetical protein